MVGSPATVDFVITRYAVHSIYVVLVGTTEHPVRASPALLEVSVRTAVEIICSGVAVQILASPRTIHDLVAGTIRDLIPVVGTIDIASLAGTLGSAVIEVGICRRRTHSPTSLRGWNCAMYQGSTVPLPQPITASPTMSSMQDNFTPAEVRSLCLHNTLLEPVRSGDST
jgi:hypothetical protein